MCSLEKASFAIASLGLVLSLGIAKRVRIVNSGPSLKEYLDWIDDDEELQDDSENGFLTPKEGPSSPSATQDNLLFRSLASVGLAPTSAKQARGPKQAKSESSTSHPATGNDEIADDVVRLQRVSEEEEAERYFSPFSYFSS